MKRIVTLLLALLLLCVAPLALAETARDAYLGNWTLHSFKLNGQSYPASSLDMETIINIHGDDTAVYSMSDRFCVSPVTYTATGASFKTQMVTVKLTMNPDGMMVADVGMSDMTLVLTMKRAPEAVLPAEVASVVGVWKGVQMTEDGVALNGMVDKGLAMTVYADGYAMLSVPGSSIGAKIIVEGGKLFMTDDAKGTYPIHFDAQGQMVVEMEDYGIVLTMAREGAAAPAEPAAESPFGALYGKLMQVTAKHAVDLTGVWNLAGVTLNGEWIPAEETGLDVKLTVKDGVDVLYFGGDVIEKEATVTADSVTIAGIEFVLNPTGQLTYTLKKDGMVLVVHLERAKETQPAAPKAGLDGTWKAVELEINGYALAPAEAGARVTLTINGTKATLVYNENSHTADITIEGNSVYLPQDDDLLVFTLNEKGQLCNTVTGEDTVIVWRLEKQAD